MPWFASTSAATVVTTVETSQAIAPAKALPPKPETEATASTTPLRMFKALRLTSCPCPSSSTAKSLTMLPRFVTYTVVKNAPLLTNRGMMSCAAEISDSSCAFTISHSCSVQELLLPGQGSPYPWLEHRPRVAELRSRLSSRLRSNQRPCVGNDGREDVRSEQLCVDRTEGGRCAALGE